MRQYVAIEFNPGDPRTYTYHNDAEPCGIGDIVQVSTARGRQKVEVISLPQTKPPFPTKPIDKIIKAAPPPAIIDEEIPDMTGDPK